MGIEQFEILKTLGEGAFASVHKVREPRVAPRRIGPPGHVGWPGGR